jgi:predicted DNA-binding transcriptional regulator YafY
MYARDLCEPTERTGHPLGLVAKGSTWYLVANVGGETRTYRVSRMRQAAALDRPAACQPDFDLAAHWEHSAAEFREKLPHYYATFLANPSVMRWVRYRGWRLEEETLKGDRVRLKLRFDIEDEAVQFALSFGGDIEVIEPGELREKVLAGARAILDKSQFQTPHSSLR